MAGYSVDFEKEEKKKRAMEEMESALGGRSPAVDPEPSVSRSPAIDKPMPGNFRAPASGRPEPVNPNKVMTPEDEGNKVLVKNAIQAGNNPAKYEELVQSGDETSNLSLALLQFAPMLLGGLFGGAGGVAAGAQAGGSAVNYQLGQDKENKQKQLQLRLKDLEEKKILAKEDREVAQAGKIEEARLQAKKKYPEQSYYQFRTDPETGQIIRGNTRTGEIESVGSASKLPAGPARNPSQEGVEEFTPAQRKRADIIRKDFSSNKVVQLAQKKLTSAAELRDLLRMDNPLADEGAKAAFARLSGEVGVLTDQDIARFGGSRALKAKLNQAISNAKSGTLTPENRKYLQEAATVLEKANQDIINREIGKISKGHSGQGLTPGQIQTVLSPYLYEGQPAQEAPRGPAQGQQGSWKKVVQDGVEYLYNETTKEARPL